MKHRVLVVDDNGEVRRLLQLTLEFGVFELREAVDGASALEAVRAWRPHVVLLDVMMPGEKDGYAVCTEIKADPELASTYVCLLTARGQMVDVQHGRKLGADAYLVKPFSPTKLVQIICGATGEPVPDFARDA